MNAAARVLFPQAERKGLAFVVSIMPDVPPYVRGDPGHLRQVLINLLGNAVKFTESGSVTLHVARLAEENGHTQLKFSVRDTGIGIAPEHQRRIFESFTQADQSVTRRYGATGLATALSKLLVERMGGRIGLERSPLDTAFWFELEFEALGSSLDRPETGAMQMRSLSPEDGK